MSSGRPENDLVDELRLLVFPLTVGAGRRLFPDAGVAIGEVDLG
jgi:dihydrofolate reductase